VITTAEPSAATGPPTTSSGMVERALSVAAAAGPAAVAHVSTASSPAHKANAPALTGRPRAASGAHMLMGAIQPRSFCGPTSPGPLRAAADGGRAGARCVDDIEGRVPTRVPGTVRIVAGRTLL
jgi:hypothetical protein